MARGDAKATDPRDLPNYGVAEAALYLNIPASTVRAWLLGRRGARPVTAIAQARPPALSFFNLVEVHMLDAMRAERVPMPAIRRALEYVERELHIARPLIDERFQTDGVNLFVERCGRLVNATGNGQIAMRAILRDYLRRIEFGRDHIAERLFPLAPDLARSDRRPVMFDPRVAFGRLVVAGTGVPTDVIASRHRAGESVAALARDYELDRQQIEDALAWERRAA